MTTRYFTGVDPGVYGAYAVVDGKRVLLCKPNPYHYKTVVRTYKRKGKTYQRSCEVPDAIDLDAMKEACEDGEFPLNCCGLVCVELVHGRAGWNAKSQWLLAESYFSWLAKLDPCDSSVKLLVPRAWHKLVNIDPSGEWAKKMKTATSPRELNNLKKQRSIARCLQLYPDAQLVLPGCKVPNHNLAEAILIAHAAWVLDRERRKATA